MNPNNVNPFKPLDQADMKPLHVKYTLVAAMGTFTDGYDLSVLGIVLPYVLASFGITKLTSPEGVFWATWLNALPIFGFFVGAPLFGWLANKGRKTFYGWDALTLAIGAGLQPFMPNLPALAVARFIMGIGLGADYVLSPMIIAETANAKDRGKLMAMGFAGFWVIGSAVAASLVLAMTVAGVPNDTVWRVALGLGAVWPALVVYIRRKFPETPRYSVLIKNDWEEYKKFFRAVFGHDENVPTGRHELSHEDEEMVQLFRKYLKFILVGAILWLLFDIPFYGLSFFSAYIAQSIKMNPAQLLLLGTAMGAPGILLAWLLLDRAGRKPMQSWGFLLTGLTFMIFSYFVYQYAGAPNAAQVLFLPTILAFGLAKTFMQMGPLCVAGTGMHGVELTPTKIRGIGHAINVLGGRTGVLITTFVFPRLFTAEAYTAYIFLGVVSLIGALITLAFVPETKMKGLEEISAELVHVREPTGARAGQR